MTLFFKNSIGEERIIAYPKSAKDVANEMKKFLDDRNFKSYYTRVWEENGRLKFDVGSYTEFFYLDGITFDKYRESYKGELNKN